MVQYLSRVWEKKPRVYMFIKTRHEKWATLNSSHLASLDFAMVLANIYITMLSMTLTASMPVIRWGSLISVFVTVMVVISGSY